MHIKARIAPLQYFPHPHNKKFGLEKIKSQFFQQQESIAEEYHIGNEQRKCLHWQINTIPPHIIGFAYLRWSIDSIIHRTLYACFLLP
jgi:hypothetical protein